jgi:hypothetical protein
MRVRTIAVCCYCVFLVSRADAGLGTITGREIKGWREGYYNVVIARIYDVKKDGGIHPDLYLASIKPQATLAGTFDSSLYPVLPVQFYVADTHSSIKKIPAEGALVIVVLKFLPPDDQDEHAAGFIFSDTCTFMPDQAAIVAIRGLDDPRVSETLNKLQEARANPSIDPWAPLPGKAKKADAK